MRKRARWAFLATIALVLVATPWPLGSRPPWAGLSAASLVILVGGVGLGSLMLLGERLSWTPVDAPAFAFLAWCGLQWLIGASIYPFATATEWLKMLAAYTAFRMVLEVARDARLRRTLAASILLMLVLVGSYALIEHYVWSGGINEMSDSPYGGTYPWGPFNNRNHFAGYAIPGLGLALGMTFWRAPVVLRLLAAGALAVGLTSLLGSLSRSGILAFALAATVVPLLALFGLRGERSKSRALPRLFGTLALIAALGGGAFWGLHALGGLERVGDRLATLAAPLQEPSTQGRIQIWLDTLPMIADRPVVGFGLGTFAWAHLAYRTPVESSFPQHAHNEYLELTAETGLVGAAIAVWMLWRLLGACWANFRRESRSRDAGLYLGCLVAWMGVLAYSLADFPTVAAATNYVLAILAGIGVAGPADEV